MQNFEIGILPESNCFSFSPTKKDRELFYYQTACGHMFCSKEYYIKRDFFPPLLLLYVCSGTLYLDLEKQHHQVTDGQILFFDCAQPHHYYAKDRLEFYFVHFDGPQAHALCRYINHACGIVIDGPNNEKVHREMESMVQLYESNEVESVFHSSLRLYRLVELLDNPVHSPRLRKNDDSINRAIRYIRSNPEKKTTLHELAELSGLSDYYFSHLFKEMTGFSPVNYIINVRIDQAKTLLTNTNLSIAQIAQRVGYPNSSNLIVQFTRRVGCTPAEFRSENFNGTLQRADPETGESFEGKSN